MIRAIKIAQVIVSDVVEKNIESSSKSNPLRRRGKITTRRREGVGVVVEKMKKVDELSTKIRVIYSQQ